MKGRIRSTSEMFVGNHIFHVYGCGTKYYEYVIDSFTYNGASKPDRFFSVVEANGSKDYKSKNDGNIDMDNGYNSNFYFHDKESAEAYIAFCKANNVTTAFNQKTRDYFKKLESFNIKTDLLPGDIVRRVDCNNAAVHFAGRDYEFLRYSNDCIVTACHPEDCNGGYVEYFKFVKRPQNENKVSDKVYCDYVTAIKALDSGVCLKIISNNGKAYKMSSHYNNGKHAFDLNGMSATVEEICGEWSYSVKKELHKDEMIAAMKKLLNQYVNGEKTSFNFISCPLCKVLCKSKGTDLDNMVHSDVSKDNCSICPWVVITGYTCVEQGESHDKFIKPDPAERAKELIDWIEKYKTI